MIFELTTSISEKLEVKFLSSGFLRFYVCVRFWKNIVPDGFLAPFIVTIFCNGKKFTTKNLCGSIPFLQLTETKKGTNENFYDAEVLFNGVFKTAREQPT